MTDSNTSTHAWLGPGLAWLEAYDRGCEATPTQLTGNDIRFLEVADVLTLHAQALNPAESLRDAAALESALARARNAVAYENTSAEQAGWILAEGIVKNHPFTNGNKRTALLALVDFWENNSVPVPQGPVWLAQHVLALVRQHR